VYDVEIVAVRGEVFQRVGVYEPAGIVPADGAAVVYAGHVETGAGVPDSGAALATVEVK
jgi:hypothetical protein